MYQVQEKPGSEVITMEVRFGEQTYRVASNDFLSVTQAFQKCEGSKWLEEEKAWNIPPTPQNYGRIWRFIPNLQMPNSQYSLELDNICDDFPKLMPYQCDGIIDLISKGKVLLSDSVGLGKTKQAIVWTHYIGGDHHLIICPSPLKGQWAKEIAHTLNRKCFVAFGRKKARNKTYQQYEKEGGYLIVNYEILLQDNIHELRRFDGIVYDEIHRIKNEVGKTFNKALLIVGRARLGLSATPLVNNPRELWSIMDFLCPGWISKNDFVSEYCVSKSCWNGKKYVEAIRGYTNLDLLNEKLKKFMVRRTKEEVIKQLPDKIYETVLCEPTKEQKRHIDYYMQMIKNDEGSNDVLGYIQLARMACSSLLVLKGTSSKLSLPVVEDEPGSKLEKFREIIMDLFPDPAFSNKKVVVFTCWKKMANFLKGVVESLGIRCFVVLGGMNDKDDTILQFKSCEGCAVLICTDALAEGQNLECADTLIHESVSFSRGQIVQREGRIDRMTSKNKKLTFITMVCAGTIEEYIMEKLLLKRGLFEASVDGEMALIRAIIKEKYK